MDTEVRTRPNSECHGRNRWPTSGLALSGRPPPETQNTGRVSSQSHGPSPGPRCSRRAVLQSTHALQGRQVRGQRREGRGARLGTRPRGPVGQPGNDGATARGRGPEKLLVKVHRRARVQRKRAPSS